MIEILANYWIRDFCEIWYNSNVESDLVKVDEFLTKDQNLVNESCLSAGVRGGGI